MLLYSFGGAVLLATVAVIGTAILSASEEVDSLLFDDPANWPSHPAVERQHVEARDYENPIELDVPAKQLDAPVNRSTDPVGLTIEPRMGSDYTVKSGELNGILGLGPPLLEQVDGDGQTGFSRTLSTGPATDPLLGLPEPQIDSSTMQFPGSSLDPAQDGLAPIPGIDIP